MRVASAFAIVAGWIGVAGCGASSGLEVDVVGSADAAPFPPLGGYAGPFVRSVTTNGTTCAALDTGAVYCWGYNGVWNVGDGTQIDRARPVRVLGVPPARRVSCNGVCCAITEQSDVYCWGQGTDADPLDRSLVVVPPRRIGGVTDIVAIEAWPNPCAISGTGQVWCWGGADPLPRRVPGIGPMRSFSRWRTCGVGADGIGRCWSRDFATVEFRAWRDHVSPDGTWLSMPELGPLRSLQVHDLAALAVGTDGRMFGWGRDFENGGRSNLGERLESGRFVELRRLPASRDVRLFHWGACAVGTDDIVRCWGNNFADPSCRPLGPLACDLDARPFVSNITDFDAGAFSACAVRTDGSLWCWGPNQWGEIGDGTTQPRWEPTRVEFPR